MEKRNHPHFIWADLFRPDRTRKSSIAELLKENALFCTLTQRELNHLCKIVYERVYQPDEVIFHQNDRGFGMYVIVKGRVAIKTHSSEGEVHVTTLGQGSFFGELSLVDPENIRSASATTIEKTVLVGFFKPDLMEILERKPDMGVKILFQLSTILGRRLLETTEKITLLTQARGIGQVHGDIL